MISEEDVEIAQAIAVSLGAPLTSASAPQQQQQGAKMVFVVRQDLQMKSGKIASQCCHCCLGLYRELAKPTALLNGLDMTALRLDWELNGEVIVVLKAKDLAEINELQRKAESKRGRVISYIIMDAGRTQVAPGSVTILGLFGDKSEIDEITGHLKLC